MPGGHAQAVPDRPPTRAAHGIASRARPTFRLANMHENGFSRIGMRKDRCSLAHQAASHRWRGGCAASFRFFATVVFVHWDADFRLFRVAKLRETENGRRGGCAASCSVFRHGRFRALGCGFSAFSCGETARKQVFGHWGAEDSDAAWNIALGHPIQARSWALGYGHITVSSGIRIYQWLNGNTTYLYPLVSDRINDGTDERYDGVRPMPLLNPKNRIRMRKMVE